MRQYSEAEEEAYHYGLEQEYNEIMQYSAFTDVKWNILEIILNMEYEINYDMLCFLRENLRRN